MSRTVVRVLMAVMVLNSIVVASAMVWPNIANSTGNEASMARVDFDHAFASVASAQRPEQAPAIAATVDFEGVFASVSTPRSENTPPNREKLRNAGWKRILGSS